MNFNQLNQIYCKLKSCKNISDVGKNALLELEKKDPSTARFLCNLIYNGKNPLQVIKSLGLQDKISKDKIDTIRKGYNLLKSFGLKLNIPDKAWDEAKNAITTNNDINNIPNNSQGMKGF